MADIGITYSSNPSRLIQQSGEFLSNNIRDIGKQIQGTILEINTKKDLARFAQNLQQNVNPNSEDFAQQAVQVAANHPLAIQDPRGQIALNILGKAHGEWKQAQLAVQRQGLYGNAPGIGIYNRTTGEVPVKAPEKTLIVPKNSRAIGPDGRVIVEPLPEPEAFVSTPGGMASKKTGLDPQGNPIKFPEKGKMTEAQRATGALSQKKAQLQETEDGIKLMQRDLQALRGQYKEAEKMEYATKEAKQDAESKSFFDQKIEVGKRADELEKQIKERQSQRDKLVNDLGDAIGFGGGQAETPESIREAYRNGTLTREQAKEALTKLMGQ